MSPKICMSMNIKDDILIVDCGIGFPDAAMMGVDLLIPDVTYLKEKQRSNCWHAPFPRPR
jgi:mRNA degradation ribonuclease J1/J2